MVSYEGEQWAVLFIVPLFIVIASHFMYVQHLISYTRTYYCASVHYDNIYFFLIIRLLYLYLLLFQQEIGVSITENFPGQWSLS